MNLTSKRCRGATHPRMRGRRKKCTRSVKTCEVLDISDAVEGRNCVGGGKGNATADSVREIDKIQHASTVHSQSQF